MDVKNQPFDGNLGDYLLSVISGEYLEFIITSAFVKNSGVFRLKETIEHFREQGGKVTAFVGIDLDGTSYEALSNLFEITDELYVIHSEDSSTTFHSKFYIIKNDVKATLIIGSNNLTGGGLWTNFETYSIDELDLKSPSDSNKIQTILAILEQYKDENFECSIKINSQEDIDSLLDDKYIKKESSIKNNNGQTIEQSEKTINKKFGTLSGRSLPPITMKHGKEKEGMPSTTPSKKTQTSITSRSFWFETKKMTGGSRNILDLSKTGKIIHGSAQKIPKFKGTEGSIVGGVALFGIDPSNGSIETDITIRYQGINYYGNTIKYSGLGNNPNQSWRMQLKGEDNAGNKLIDAPGVKYVNKILRFDHIAGDCYDLTIVDNSEIQDMINASIVVAANGARIDARKYGIIKYSDNV